MVSVYFTHLSPQGVYHGISIMAELLYVMCVVVCRASLGFSVGTCVLGLVLAALAQAWVLAALAALGVILQLMYGHHKQHP